MACSRCLHCLAARILFKSYSHPPDGVNKTCTLIRARCEKDKKTFSGQAPEHPKTDQRRDRVDKTPVVFADNSRLSLLPLPGSAAPALFSLARFPFRPACSSRLALIQDGVNRSRMPFFICHPELSVIGQRNPLPFLSNCPFVRLLALHTDL